LQGNTIVTAKVKSRIVQVTLGDGTYGSDNIFLVQTNIPSAKYYSHNLRKF